MKAVRIHFFGGPDQLRVEQVRKPMLEDGQILIKVFDAGVNPVDYKIREGRIPGKKLPIIIGQDFCGEVVESQGGEEFKPGEKVFGFSEGAYAEYAVSKPEKITLLPDGISEEVAAALPTAGLTAWQIVMEEAKVQEQDRVLIHGAAGGVGSVAVQLCKWLGAHVTANAAGEDQGYLRELGINEFIDYHQEKFEDKFFDFDLVIDLVGGDTFIRSFEVLKPQGKLITTVQPDNHREPPRKVIHTVLKPSGEKLARLAELVAQGVIKVKIEDVFPLELAARAQEILETEAHRGKRILKIA